MSGLMGTSRVYGHVAYVAAVLSDGSLITENYGGGNYFVEYLAASDLSQWLSSRGIVIRTQP
jgi:surface antigen